jgi:pyrroloquinoline quinone biosynthesis protein D
MLDEDSIPAFTRGTRLRHDEVRGQWVLLAPEKAFLPDEIALEILRLVDGSVSLAAIIDTLAARFEAPRAQVAADVLALARDLADRRLLQA